MLTLSSTKQAHLHAHGYLLRSIFFALNHAYNATIENISMNESTGSTCDISPLLHFHFWQPAYFNSDDSNFPSDPIEETGRFVCISENAGHGMTFLFLK